MGKVLIVSACRTPIGKMGGELSSISAVDMGACVIRETVSRASVPVKAVDHVYMGCVLQAGLGQNVARQAALRAGLPVTTTAETLNIVCGSGLDAINAAARLIFCGEADIVVAGGMESMSNAPFAAMKGRFGYRMGSPMVDSSFVDIMVKDALWDSTNNYHMGITAENVAKKWRLTREELDSFAVESQRKAVRAQEQGLFDEEIVPVVIHSKQGDITVDKDEGPRQNTTIEGLGRLKPAFKVDGIVTAGNSSSINDGAAAVLLASEEKVRECNLPVLAEWVGGALGGVAPDIMGVGPVESTRKLLSKLDIKMEEIDLVELNEAFAAQSIAVQRELEIDERKLNINGGAIALGHPVGASGCRIFVTLLYNMIHNNAHMGLAALCIGGGMGCSTIIRR